MSLQFSLFIFLCLTASVSISISAQNSPADFIKAILAILQNKQTLYDYSSTRSTFAYWQGNADFFGFSAKNGLVYGYSQTPPFTNTFLEMFLHIFSGNHTDGDGITFEFQCELDNEFAQINQTNATIRHSYASLWLSNYPNKESKYPCTPADMYIYFVEKATQLPPRTFDTSNLQAYTKQVRFISTSCGFDVTTSFFDDSYSVSLFDKALFIIGSLVYTFASWYSRTNPKPNKRKVSAGTLRLLMFFSYYTLAYIGRWLIEIYLFSDLLFLFVPFGTAMVVDFIKHSRDLSKNDGTFCWCLVLAPLPAVVLVMAFEYEIYIGNVLASLYMLPQVVVKYKERHERRRFLTRFEIGNFTCLTLWVLYLDLYPSNVFLSSPKPIVVFLYLTAALIQLSVLVYLEYGIPKKRLFKYTFAVNEPADQNMLIEEQCAICLNAFEPVNSTDNKLYKTPCGHLFHPDCLKEWGDKKLECPCCRKKIPGFAEPID